LGKACLFVLRISRAAPEWRGMLCRPAFARGSR
jgi:hypothetical protein